MKTQFKLRNATLLMALAAAYPFQAHSAAGVAQFAAGEATMRRADTTQGQPLTKGREIESGDTIVTGPNGQAQIRFSDGGLVSLRANTQFKIASYSEYLSGERDRLEKGLALASCELRAKVESLAGRESADAPTA